MSRFWPWFRRQKQNALESASDRKREEARAWALRYYVDSPGHEIAARFVIILESQINVPIHQFAPQTRFLEDLGMEDLEPVEVIMAVEEEFGLHEIPNDEAQRICTVDEMIRYVVKVYHEEKA